MNPTRREPEEFDHARCALHRSHCRDIRAISNSRARGGKTVIVFQIIGAVLAVAALVYLVYALVKPEKF